MKPRIQTLSELNAFLQAAQWRRLRSPRWYQDRDTLIALALYVLGLSSLLVSWWLLHHN